MTRRAALAAAVVVASRAAVAATPGRTGPGALRFQKIRHGALRIELDGVGILVDPWLSRGPGGGVLVETAPTSVAPEALGASDLLLLTSSAPDRLDGWTLRRLGLRDTRVLVPDERAARTARDAGARRVRVVAHGERWRVGGVDVTTCGARDLPLSGPALGYLLERGGRAVFIGGALLPISVDDRVGRFAREHRAEVVFADVGPEPLADAGLAAPASDVVLLGRLFRARYIVPTGDAVALGVVPRALGLDDDATRGLVVEGEPRVLVAEPGVFYRVARPASGDGR